jgi:hypothetical protein
MPETPIIPEVRETGDLEAPPISQTTKPSAVPKAGPVLDKYLGRFVSKKLSVLIVGCVFLYLGKLPASDWMALAMVYMAGQSVIDTALAWKSGRRV